MGTYRGETDFSVWPWVNHYTMDGTLYTRDEVLWDNQAYVCRDCLMLHANGEYGEEAYDWHPPLLTRSQRVDDNLAGFRLTLGWGRELHDCASNYTVTPIYRHVNYHLGSPREMWGYEPVERSEESREYYADSASEAIDKAEFDFRGHDEWELCGFRVIAHELETDSDRGTDDYCDQDEGIGFSTHTCISCDDTYAGSWHGATLWKIVEGPKRENGTF
jgi:hypothetical protein